MMKAGHFKWLSVMVMVMAAVAVGQELPKIAVYVKGGMGDEVKAAFRNELLFALVKSERYSAVDDNDAFVAAVNKEMKRHGVSDMNDMQIGKAGENVNADFVCVVSVSSVLGGYQVFARVIDVKNEAVAEMGRGAGAIASVADVAKIAGEIVESMLGVSGKAAPQVQAAVPAQQIMPEQQAAEVTPAAETPAARPRGPIKAAVYVTGVPDLVGKTLNSAISSALIKSKIYAGIESIDVSGAPSVPALADAGRNAGVSYIFAINVAGQISVAIIDVAGTMELAKISIDGKITAINAAAIAKEIVDFILTSGPKPDPDAQIAEETAPVQTVGYESDGKPRILKRGIRLEAGGALDFYHREHSYEYWDDTNTIHRIHAGFGFGVGGYLHVDLIYAEVVVDMVIPVYGNIGILAKYPIGNETIKVSPLLGLGFGGPVIIGGRIDVGMSETAYLRSELLFGLPNDITTMFKIGGGFDIPFGESKKTYLRPELFYRWMTGSDDSVHSLDLRVGIGYKW
jgi:hypothetical protein